MSTPTSKNWKFAKLRQRVVEYRLKEQVEPDTSWWLEKIDTLLLERDAEVKAQILEKIDKKLLAFFALYSIDRPIPPSEIRKEWESLLNNAQQGEEI